MKEEQLALLPVGVMISVESLLAAAWRQTLD